MTAEASSGRRVDSIDVVRGIVMIVMALDHVRDFFGVPAKPTDPARASTALFFTRWITHICAPTFFLLTGVGARLRAGPAVGDFGDSGHHDVGRPGRQEVGRPFRGAGSAALSRYLLSRGAWLILLELTLLRCFGYQFNVDYRVTMLIILWALGWAMIALAALVHLPPTAVGAFGVVLIAGHNLFDGIRPASFGALAPLWTIVHVPGFVYSGTDHVVFAAYPLVPWIGVTAAGYALGGVFAWAPAARRRLLLRLGLALTIGFVVLRALNVYGDPVRWSHQATAMRTALSFLNANKYPPSLLFLLMTLGPSLLLLRALDRATPRLLGPALTFGRVPLFYFLLHMPLIHLLAIVICQVRYGDIHWMFESPTIDRFPMTFPPGWGYSLPVVYALWIAVVVALYPACWWFAELKRRRRDPWLSYL